MLRLLVLTGLLGCQGTPQRNPSSVHEGFPDAHPSLLITNPRTLLALETSGWSFGDVLGARDPGSLRRADYAEESADVLIRRSSVYSDLAEAVRHDLEVLAASSPDVGVGLNYLNRMFDPAWLSSERSHYELVGVVNRFDLRTQDAPGCGQTRLIYRLAYQPARSDRSASRLPMTISMIERDLRTDCGDVARQWLAIEDAKGGDLAAVLRSGPFAYLRPTALDRIEINLQSLRETEFLPGTGFQEQAQYILRGFDVINGHLVASPLRNTPTRDLSGAKLAALRAWIREHVAAIDAGTAEIPADFLATTAVSVAPYGLGRRANRPFRKLFPDTTTAFADLDLHRNQLVTSPELLVRRLDELSCMGCHQARAIAGFHLLGEARSGDPDDAMVIGVSPHLREMLAWRYRFLRAAATGRDLADVMPLPEHADDGGGYGAHCTPRAGIAGGPEWHCATGLECRPNPVDGNDIGLCIVAGGTHAGDPCQNIKLVPASGVDDEVASPKTPLRCAIEVPRAGRTIGTTLIGRCNVRGFAGGMCTAICNLGAKINGAVCAVGQRPGFERACFRPDVKPEDCLKTPGNFTQLLLQTCSRTEPCRDDYVCIRVPDHPIDRGACAPPYLLRQIRVDHAPIDL